MPNGANKSETLPIPYLTQSEPTSPVDTKPGGRGLMTSFDDSHLPLPIVVHNKHNGVDHKNHTPLKSFIWDRLSGSGRRKKKKKKEMMEKTKISNRQGFINTSDATLNNPKKSIRQGGSVMEEEIKLTTLNRRDRNSVVIRKSLALDDSTLNDLAFATAKVKIDNIVIKEPGKGHNFVVQTNEDGRLLWCDICGEPIISLLYVAKRCMNCGYLCHDSCQVGVGLDCPEELEKQFEQQSSSSVSVSSLSSSSSEVSTPVSDSREAPPNTADGRDSDYTTQFHSDSEHGSEYSSAVSTVFNNNDNTLNGNHNYHYSNNKDVGSNQAAAKSSQTSLLQPSVEHQVQKWAQRVHRSNTLSSKGQFVHSRASSASLSLRMSTYNDDSSTPLVGSAAKPKMTTASHDTLPSKLKNKDLEKRINEYAKRNPQSDMRIVSKGKLSKENSKSKDNILSNNSNKKKEEVEFEGFLHVTMCLHRPISVANEVALDFSLESLHKNMSFERSKSENRTTFYLPYGSEHAVRCASTDSALRVVTKLLEKFHVADDPRKYTLFHDHTSPDGSVTRRKLSDDERPLYLALLYENSSGVGNTSKNNYVFVLEENEQSEIQWDCFSEQELLMFLEILRMEEEQHIALIKEKYEKEKRLLSEKLEPYLKYREEIENGDNGRGEATDYDYHDGVIIQENGENSLPANHIRRISDSSA